MSRFPRWILKLFGMARDEGPEAEEIKALTNQFYVSLHAYLSAIETQDRPSSGSDKVLERIRELASKPPEDRTWPNAYDLEQQLVLLYDEETLETELGRRLLEARKSLQPDVAKWYDDAAEKVDEPAKKRAILTRLVNDIQWRYTKDEARRGYTKQITQRTEFIFLAAVVVFVATTIMLITKPLSATHLDLMPFVGAAGAFGASFSMMTSLQSRLGASSFDDLKLNRSWGLILVRVLIGTGASFVVYFFVISGLLAGDAFPELAKSADPAKKAGFGVLDPNFAKLFIWSFLAGFSEKLIPNLLARTESQFSEPAQLPPQGARSSPTIPVTPEPSSTGTPESQSNRKTGDS